MSAAYVVDAVRTPIGRRNGGLAGAHPADLLGFTLAELIGRTGVDPGAVDDVIAGCLDQLGPQAANVARTAWLAAGLPEHVPGTTIDRQCGSSQQAVHFAAQAVMSGTQDLVVAAGVQNMSMVPLTAAWTAGESLGLPPDPFSGSPGWVARFGDQEISQFHGAELVAERWEISREEMERLAVRSHERAIAARDDGRFDREIAPFDGVAADECPRQPDWDKIRSLPPLRPGGRLTAATASQISDGAAAILIAGEAALRDHGLTPRARIETMTVVGADPVLMLSAPIPATRAALDRAGLSIEEIDRIEINEAFACVVSAWERDLGADPERVNVNGGAIALGHPLGASGARLITTLLNELERGDGRYGLVTMCEAGGTANATIIERV